MISVRSVVNSTQAHQQVSPPLAGFFVVDAERRAELLGFVAPGFTELTPCAAALLGEVGRGRGYRHRDRPLR